MVFGMNDAVGTFATWPGTMGIAAAVKGAGLKLQISSQTVSAENGMPVVCARGICIWQM